jgi:hypothetical protein
LLYWYNKYAADAAENKVNLKYDALLDEVRSLLALLLSLLAFASTKV